jgi:hypothetical protein
MPESSKTVLIWDGSQKFEDKVFERFLDGGNGGRIARQWYMNSDASIAEHNLEEFGNTLSLEYATLESRDKESGRRRLYRCILDDRIC